MNTGSRKTATLLAAIAALTATSAMAETLPVSAIYAAGEDAPSQFQTIVIESFDGNEGAKFALELRDTLSRARIEGERYFDVRRNSGPGEGPGPVAWVNGTAFSEIERFASGTTQESKCVEKDADGKCIQRKTTTYKCRELSVSFTGEMQMLDERDELIYDGGFSTNGSKRYCANQSSVPRASQLIAPMIERFAWEVRRDLAPIERSEDIRVLESRKEMDKALRKPFKKALRLTKTDWQAACGEFERLHAQQPGNVTLTFNAGLCREADADLDGAEALYRRTLELAPGKDYASAGLRRLSSRRRAEEQLALHADGSWTDDEVRSVADIEAAADAAGEDAAD